MADTHETIADIIAEKRRRAEEIERDCAEKMKRGEMVSDRYARELVADIRREVDRLDAAHKRERGDAAKLREALKHIKDRLPHMLQYMRVHWEDANAGGYFDELMLVIDAALAAPPRNCDRFASAEEAWDAYDEWVDSYRAQGKTEPFNEFGWLFAPATEKEGGAK